jgi:hypothetical protein
MMQHAQILSPVSLLHGRVAGRASTLLVHDAAQIIIVRNPD